jgi:hypothetical protein
VAEPREMKGLSKPLTEKGINPVGVMTMNPRRAFANCVQ